MKLAWNSVEPGKWPRRRAALRQLTAAFAFAGALLTAAPAEAFAVDLTQVLTANPKVAEGVARLCKRACLGNQRKSWLESAIVHADPAGSSLTVILKLRSRQSPARGVVLYDETATIKVDADVSLADCGIGEVHASSNNDLYRALLRALSPQIKAAIRRQARFC
jgi:hypothetical protein